MSKRNDDDVLVGLLTVVGLLTLLPLLALASGLVFHYAWDVVILHTFKSAPRIGIAQSIGIGMMVTYYTAHTETYTGEKKPNKTLLLEAGWRMGMFLLVIWVLHFFIAGA